MNLIIDNISIIAAATLAFLTLAATLTDVFLRKPKLTESPCPVVKDEDGTSLEAEDEAVLGSTIDGVDETCRQEEPQEKVVEQEEAYRFPPVSIIVTPHNNAYELEQNLPLLLNQDYPAPFKVIVVFWRGESDTDDVLKKYAANPHLYSTYIPDSSRYMSRKKLAITVGEKAAETEWLLLTDITCRPQSPYWLRAMARHASKERNLVLGHTRYDEDTPSFRRFLRSYTSLYLMQEMERGTAYRCEGNALMLRRSEFEHRDGFRGNLKYLRGEYDFTVNEYAHAGSAALENSEDGTLVEQSPTDKEWRNKLLYYMENRQHMARNTAHRWRHNLSQTLLHVSLTALVAGCVFAFLTQRWLLLAVSTLLLILSVTIRTWLGSRALQSMGEPIPTWKVFPYEWRLVWHYFAFYIRYWRANKDDFITHKI